MDLSIIIGSYNEAPYIERAFESVINQDFYGDYEIIISDDGSNDGSVDIILKLAQQYDNVKCVLNQNRNDGVFLPAVRASNTIKRALAVCEGKYITILSADDYYCSNEKYSKAIAFLDQASSHKYAATYTDFKKTYINKPEEKIITNAPDCRNLIIANYYISLSTFVFRREVYDMNNLLDRYCSDVGMLYSICMTGKIKKIDGVTFCHFQRDGSITHTEDYTDFCVGQMVFLQDIINKKRFVFSSLCRFYREITAVYNNRKILDDLKYQKIISYCDKFDNNILKKIYDYDRTSYIKKMSLKIFLLYSRFSFVFFKTINRIYRLV